MKQQRHRLGWWLQPRLRGSVAMPVNDGLGTVLGARSEQATDSIQMQLPSADGGSLRQPYVRQSPHFLSRKRIIKGPPSPWMDLAFSIGLQLR